MLMKQFKPAGSFYHEKNFCIVTRTVSVHSLNKEGFDEATL